MFVNKWIGVMKRMKIWNGMDGLWKPFRLNRYNQRSRISRHLSLKPLFFVKVLSFVLKFIGS
jgi:hypothetical protein